MNLGMPFHHLQSLKKPIVDGTCIVQPLVGPGFVSARASEQNLVLGAAAVIHDCVGNPTSQGGLAKEISK